MISFVVTCACNSQRVFVDLWHICYTIFCTKGFHNWNWLKSEFHFGNIAWKNDLLISLILHLWFGDGYQISTFVFDIFSIGLWVKILSCYMDASEYQLKLNRKSTSTLLQFKVKLCVGQVPNIFHGFFS